MKTLLLLRHAKSDWHVGTGDDHERPLNDRGERAARQVGRFLAATGLAPDAVLTSTATRARSTVALAAEAGGWRTDVRETRALYLPEPEAVLDVIRSTDDAAEVLLVAGHEPATGRVVTLLTGAHVRIPTACLAGVALDVPRWADVATGRGVLQWLLPPRLLEPVMR